MQFSESAPPSIASSSCYSKIRLVQTTFHNNLPQSTPLQGMFCQSSEREGKGRRRLVADGSPFIIVPSPQTPGVDGMANVDNKSMCARQGRPLERRCLPDTLSVGVCEGNAAVLNHCSDSRIPRSSGCYILLPPGILTRCLLVIPIPGFPAFSFSGHSISRPSGDSIPRSS